MQNIVVMTGGSSGLGLVAARELAAGADLLVLGRSEPAVGRLVRTDLTDLGSVRSALAEVRRLCSDAKISALVLNAGGYGEGRTNSGYDATFVLNYLSHYLLVEELWASLGVGAHVVLTTSGTHDPREKSRVPPPRHADALKLARPEDDDGLEQNPTARGRHAYAAAKLCVVLRARALATRAGEDHRGVHVIAYDPGPTPGTGLARSLSPVARFVWESTPWLVRWLTREKSNTVEDAGTMLAALASGSVDAVDGEVYAALRRGELTWPGLCELAADDVLMSRLESDSETLVRTTESTATHT